MGLALSDQLSGLDILICHLSDHLIHLSGCLQIPLLNDLFNLGSERGIFKIIEAPLSTSPPSHLEDQPFLVRQGQIAICHGQHFLFVVWQGSRYLLQQIHYVI